MESRYEAISGGIISVKYSDGTTREFEAKVADDGTLFWRAYKYRRATPLALSLDLLIGEWTGSSDRKVVFTENSTYVIESVLPGWVSDTVESFTITGSNTMDVPGNGGQKMFFDRGRNRVPTIFNYQRRFRY